MFMQDLITEIKNIEQDPKNWCILMWDANKNIDDKQGT